MNGDRSTGRTTARRLGALAVLVAVIVTGCFCADADAAPSTDDGLGTSTVHLRPNDELVRAAYHPRDCSIDKPHSGDLWVFDLSDWLGQRSRIISLTVVFHTGAGLHTVYLSDVEVPPVAGYQTGRILADGRRAHVVVPAGWVITTASARMTGHSGARLTVAATCPGTPPQPRITVLPDTGLVLALIIAAALIPIAFTLTPPRKDRHDAH